MTPLLLPAAPAEAARQLRRVEDMLDAHVMGPRLRAALGALPRGGCHVLDGKYEPGVRCTALYGVGDLLVRADLLDEESEALEEGSDPSRPIVEPGVRLFRFPDDPDLPGLRDVADPVTLRAALRSVWPGAGPILRCRVGLLRYRPGKRATLAVEARGASAGPARRSVVERYVVKSYHDPAKAAAVAAEAVLLAATGDPGAPLRFAAVHAHLPDLSLVVQEHLTGTRLDQVARAPGPEAGRAFRRAARALAALHHRPVVSRRTRAVDAEVARFGARAGRVAAVHPATGAALESLAFRLADTAGEVPTDAVGLVHGDCRPSQFLLCDEREVALLDLDSCGRADPAGDVGTFLATLRQHTLRQVLAGRTTPSGARTQAALAELFLEAYLEAAGAAADPDLRRRISWFEAVALERKALRCFARAPGSPLTCTLVQAGHARLDRLGGLP
jgi:aminoglycoside phosphotransferase (APT) family kinase protein